MIMIDMLSKLKASKEHLGEKSHLGQHISRAGHRPVTLNDFKILSLGFKLPRDRKIAEALLIKSRSQTLMCQGGRSH